MDNKRLRKLAGILTESSVDTVAAEEIYDYINNDSMLYVSVEACFKSLAKRMKAGNYNHKLAPQIFAAVVNKGISQYSKDFGPLKLDKATKEEVAKMFADYFKAEYDLGNIKESEESVTEANTDVERFKPDGTPFTQEEFDKAFQAFMKRAQEIVDKELVDKELDDFHDNRKDLPEHFKKVLSADPKGIKFIRIVIKSKGSEHGSAWAFIDKTTGDVLKPDGWKKPAKGPRGNIFDEKNGTGRIRWTGPEYNK